MGLSPDDMLVWGGSTGIVDVWRLGEGFRLRDFDIILFSRYYT